MKPWDNLRTVIEEPIVSFGEIKIMSGKNNVSK